jgi:DNA-directed RNA polymerase subunit K/omega
MSKKSTPKKVKKSTPKKVKKSTPKKDKSKQKSSKNDSEKSIGTEEVKNCELENILSNDKLFFDENNQFSKDLIINDDNRISKRFLTKYEFVRVIGERTKQLKMGAKPLVKNYTDLSYENIAIEELKKNMIPFKIKRPIGNKFEIWKLEELKKDNIETLLEY